MHGLEQSSGTRYLVSHRRTAEAPLHCGGDVGGAQDAQRRFGGWRDLNRRRRLRRRRRFQRHIDKTSLRLPLLTNSLLPQLKDHSQKIMKSWQNALRQMWRGGSKTWEMSDYCTTGEAQQEKKIEKTRHLAAPRAPRTLFPPFFDVCQHRQNQSTSPKTIRQLGTPPPTSPPSSHLSQQIKRRWINFGSSW